MTTALIPQKANALITIVFHVHKTVTVIIFLQQKNAPALQEGHVSNVLMIQTARIPKRRNAHRILVFLAQTRLNANIFLPKKNATALQELALNVALIQTVLRQRRIVGRILVLAKGA